MLNTEFLRGIARYVFLSPAKNVWLVDARPRDIVYRETRAAVAGKLNWCYLFASALFCFCNNFSVNVITAASSVSGLFFQWLKYAIYFFCRFLPCPFFFGAEGMRGKCIQCGTTKSSRFFGEKHHQRCRGCYKKSVS